MSKFGFEVVDRLNEELRAVAARQRAPLADVRAALGGDRRHFVDSVHLRDGGNARLATIVAKAIVGARLLDGRPPRAVRPLRTR